MSKRSKLIIVILIALLLLLLGLYLILSPFLAQRLLESGVEYSVPTAAKQTSGAGNVAKPTATGQATEEGAATTKTPQKPASDNLRNLEYRARAAVERVGSGSNQNGFLGYGDLMIDSTENFKAELKQQQAAMLAAHPVSGGAFGVSTRSVSSQIKDQQYGDATLKAEVQAIQTYDAGNPRLPTGKAAKRVYVTFAKQADGSYLIDGMKWEDMEL